MLPSSEIRLDSARRLVFSPSWDQLAVVFDARSGDFWVVNSEVHDALRSACNVPTHAAAYLQQLTPEVIENLAAHGIIQAPSTS